ncbi:MAG: surface protein, partial [Polaribacter sp.]
MKNNLLLLLCIIYSSINFSQNEFITKWKTTSDNESITIPIGDGTFDYTVDWGDGTEESGFTGDATHSYATLGDHTVIITGQFDAIKFQESSISREKIIEVVQWGNNKWLTFYDAFSFCTNIQVTATDAPNMDSPNFTMQRIFADATNFNSDINHWDVSNVTNMEDVFLKTSFNQPLNNWNVSNVTNMQYMFEGSLFNQPLNNWDVSKVNSMLFMFRNTPFNQNINNWNVSSVNQMGRMFDLASNFNQPLNNWDVSNVKDMYHMFNDAALFNQSLADWNVGKVTRMTNMFQGAVSLNIDNYDATLIEWSNQNVQRDIILNASSSYCASETARNKLINDFGWTITDNGRVCVTDFITKWKTTSDNESITIPIGDGTFDYTVDWGDGTEESGFIGDATHSYTTLGDHTVKITGQFDAIKFQESSVSREKIIEVVQWGNNKWLTFDKAFSFCTNIQVTATDAPNLDNPNFSSMSSMFFNATNFNSDINHWNVSSVTDMSNMFYKATNFNQPLNNWDVSKVTNMFFMFTRASNFNQDINNWDVSSVTEMGAMFELA